MSASVGYSHAINIIIFCVEINTNVFVMCTSFLKIRLGYIHKFAKPMTSSAPVGNNIYELL